MHAHPLYKIGHLFWENTVWMQHPNIVAYLLLDRNIYWHSHHIRWNKCISHHDKNWADYHCNFERQTVVFKPQRNVWLILTPVLWSWDPSHNITHDMHFAQYSPGITTVDFLVCWKTTCVSVPAYPKMIKLQQRSWLNFDPGNRHV